MKSVPLRMDVVDTLVCQILLFDILLQWAQGNCPMRRIGHVSPGQFVKPTNCLKTSAHAIYAKDWLFCKTEAHKLSEEFTHWASLNTTECFGR